MKLPEWQTVQRYPSGFRFPSGESFVEMQTRMVDTVARLSGPSTRRAWWSPCRTPTRSRPRWPTRMGTHLDLFQRIVISTCSVTAIAYGTGGPVVLTVNSTGGVARPAQAVVSSNGCRR